MRLKDIVLAARQRGASDAHIEPGVRVMFRVSGELVESALDVTAANTEGMVQELLGEEDRRLLAQRGSVDTTRAMAGVQCRINILQTWRGLGMAVRLLPSRAPRVSSLNLHPDIATLAHRQSGLILVCGPTGSGKSSTLAALLEEINRAEARHVVTVEQPIEFPLRPRRSLIRQREVGRDTPSFAQALIDAMREDPDVIMVGELRDPETMRLTLNAAETGHLVLSTVHSATVAEALQRVVLAFPAEIERSVAAQLADCLQAVICQRLVFNRDAGLRVPECEILLASTAARAVIRQTEFFKLGSVLDAGGQDGMWTWARYHTWLQGRRDLQPQTFDAEDDEPIQTPQRRSLGWTRHSNVLDDAPSKQSGRMDAPATDAAASGTSAQEELERLERELLNRTPRH